MKLNIEDIRAGLNNQDVQISLFDSIDSTSSWLLENGSHGDICLSETQTAGRGRRGNQWISPDAGNIYFSMCWCFKEIAEHWSLLGLVVGVAIADTLQAVGLKHHGIKWPNDIFWHERKLGGILLESQDQSGRVVIGIGLNINMSEETRLLDTQLISQPWVSVQEAMQEAIHETTKSEQVSRNHLLSIMINNLRSRLSNFSTLKLDDFLNVWKSWDVLSERLVSVQHNGEESSGKVMGINQLGQIGIQMENEEVRYFSSAEIKLVPR